MTLTWLARVFAEDCITVVIYLGIFLQNGQIPHNHFLKPNTRVR